MPNTFPKIIIGEIIISHGKQSTYFNCYSNNIPIHNRKDWDLNKTFGLSLRFIAGQTAKYKTLVFIDDDLIVHPATITNMYKEYLNNYPCMVGRFGRYIDRGLNYDSRDVPDNIKSTPILLTSLLMMDKSLCDNFFRYSDLISKYVFNNSVPLWNGEDIFLSLIAIKLYNKWGILVAHPKYYPIYRLRTDRDIEVAISTKVGHCRYRSNLIKKISKLYNIPPTNLY